jgi:hypothetical protein
VLAWSKPPSGQIHWTIRLYAERRYGEAKAKRGLDDRAQYMDRLVNLFYSDRVDSRASDRQITFPVVVN